LTARLPTDSFFLVKTEEERSTKQRQDQAPNSPFVERLETKIEADPQWIASREALRKARLRDLNQVSHKEANRQIAEGASVVRSGPFLLGHPDLDD